MLKSNRRIAIITAVILVTGFLLALSVEYGVTTKSARENARMIMFDDAQEQTDTLTALLDGQFNALNVLAGAVIDVNALNPERMVSRLESLVELSLFQGTGYADVEGNAITDTGAETYIGDRAYFKRAISGERALERVPAGKLNPDPRFIMAVPVRIDNEIAGIIYGAYDESGICDMFISRTFSGEGYSYVISAYGDVVIRSDSESFLATGDNILEFLSHVKLAPGYSLDETIANIKARGFGSVSYTWRGERRFLFFAPYDYAPLTGDSWILMNSVPDSIITAEVSRISSASTLAFGILIVFVGVTVFLMALNERQTRRILTAEAARLRISREEYRIVAEQSGKLVLRYDVRTKTAYQTPAAAAEFDIPEVYTNVPESAIEAGLVAQESIDDYINYYESMQRGDAQGSVQVLLNSADGGFIWYQSDFSMVYDDDGKPLHAIISFYDATEQREKDMAYTRWRQSLDKRAPSEYRAYEFNLSRDYCENCEGALFAQDAHIVGKPFNQAVSAFVNAQVVYEDASELLELLDRDSLLAAYRDGKYMIEYDFRLIRTSGEPRWVRMTAQMFEYLGTSDIKLYLLLVDIDEEKRRSLDVKERSEADPLTNTLNRREFIEQVSALLITDSAAQHAFLMLDIDGFKMVNDNLGHMTGDRVLVLLADNLRSILREGDLIGRMGGDEFMICLKNIPYDDVIERRAELIIQLMHMRLHDEMSISGSIGIAMYPRDGHTFDELYAKVDAALYAAKQKGRDRFEFYQPGIGAGMTGRQNTPIDEISDMNEVRSTDD